mmetsp:Transcript_4246/g.11953  ORF Transcript_4246/g.11953 Transcript_4246/m.11953 type:complete len:249 (+) Transcript_4246:925-1671(+)
MVAAPAAGRRARTAARAAFGTSCSSSPDTRAEDLLCVVLLPHTREVPRQVWCAAVREWVRHPVRQVPPLQRRSSHGRLWFRECVRPRTGRRVPLPDDLGDQVLGLLHRRAFVAVREAAHFFTLDGLRKLVRARSWFALREARGGVEVPGGLVRREVAATLGEELLPRLLHVVCARPRYMPAPLHFVIDELGDLGVLAHPSVQLSRTSLGVVRHAVVARCWNWVFINLEPVRWWISVEATSLRQGVRKI